MLLDLAKHWIPERWLPWILAVLTVGWIGWQTNNIYALVTQHYMETHQTVSYTKQTCRAVQVLAKMDPKQCEEN